MVTRKHHLARNLMRMRREFPLEYDFFPTTWIIPGEIQDLRNEFDRNKGKKITYIVKPDSLSQGKGIFLSRRLDVILKNIEETREEQQQGFVIQQYLDCPHLIEDLKYDLRIYVLLYGVNPLRIYIHKEGIARFCTEPYRKPNGRNLSNLYMHLTNYAINKHNSKFQQNEASESDDAEEGHKRSLAALLNILKAEGANIQKL